MAEETEVNTPVEEQEAETTETTNPEIEEEEEGTELPISINLNDCSDFTVTINNFPTDECYLG